MSEEEKKIIETINDYIKKKEKLGDLCDDFTINFRDTKPLKTLLNLIEKQQKQIEALEIIHNTYKEMIEENDYISKDKIREKIKELLEEN